MSHFYALDVETANSDVSSICQIGIAEFKDGDLVGSWSSFINPECEFSEMNIHIHGITPEKVSEAPNFKEVHLELYSMLQNKTVIHHTSFDKAALNQACEACELEVFGTNWIDSAKIVRRTWEDCAHSGFGLAAMTKKLEIKYKAHDALEDAVAAGKVVLKAFEASGMGLEDWITRIQKPINLYKNGSTTVKLDGNPDGPLFGENLVFTGSLTLTRAEAAKLAADLGCNVTNSVTKKTTLLVVGSQDDFKLAGYAKSSKHRKAEDLILKGIPLRILSENDFRKLIQL